MAGVSPYFSVCSSWLRDCWYQNTGSWPRSGSVLWTSGAYLPLIGVDWCCGMHEIIASLSGFRQAQTQINALLPAAGLVEKRRWCWIFWTGHRRAKHPLCETLSSNRSKKKKHNLEQRFSTRGPQPLRGSWSLYDDIKLVFIDFNFLHLHIKYGIIHAHICVIMWNVWMFWNGLICINR